MSYETILYEEDGPIGTITLNRPDDGNMFTVTMCHEIRDCINAIRRETRTRVIVITGAGDKFFCIGGRKEGMEDLILYAGTLPTLEMYESIDRLQKPVIASVNGFAVGGGNVLQVVCDLTIAKESAIFRQVGPMMGSFDAGYGTWYLEDMVGKKKAKENLVPQPQDHRPRGARLSASSTRSWRTRISRRRRASSPLKSLSAGRSHSLPSRARSTPATAAFRALHGSHTTCSCARILKPRKVTSYRNHSPRDENPILRNSGDDPVRPFLTLHHPLQTRRYYEQGLWQQDTFYGLVAKHAAARPETVALQDGRRRLTWSELQAWVDGVAADLCAYGLVGGDRVSIWMSNRLETIVTFLACSREGLACNPSLHRTHTCGEIGGLPGPPLGKSARYRAGLGR